MKLCRVVFLFVFFSLSVSSQAYATVHNIAVSLIRGYSSAEVLKQIKEMESTYRQVVIVLTKVQSALARGMTPADQRGRVEQRSDGELAFQERIRDLHSRVGDIIQTANFSYNYSLRHHEVADIDLLKEGKENRNLIRMMIPAETMDYHYIELAILVQQVLEEYLVLSQNPLVQLTTHEQMICNRCRTGIPDLMHWTDEVIRQVNRVRGVEAK